MAEKSLLESALAPAREVGFLRGINFAADILQSRGECASALAVLEIGVSADSFRLANAGSESVP